MGRPAHQNRQLAKYLFVERGLTDLAQLAAITGISPKTLENYRAEEGWLDARGAQQVGEDSALESLDDVAEAVTRQFFLKAQEYCDLPPEMFDHDTAKALRHLVETIKMLTADIRRMSKRDRLLIVQELLNYALRQQQDAAIDMAALNQFFEVLGGYSDEVLG